MSIVVPKGRKHLSRQVVLAAVPAGAARHQRQDAVTDHLGVDPEVVLVRELHHHGVGDTAVADLQRRTVFDHVGDVLADGHLHRADLRQSHFEHRLAAFDQRCNPRDVHMTVSVRKGDVRIHLEHHRAGPGDGGHGVVGAQAEGEIAVGVHRRCHAEYDVGRNLPAFDVARDFGEAVGNEVDPALLPAGAGGGAVEKGDVTHVIRSGRVDVGELAHRKNLRNLHVVKIAALLR
jgi:hypothetical protein